MLGSLRKVSQSWYAKILFVPLIALFAIWGIGDVMRMRAENKPALTVGDEKFSADEVAEEFRHDVERMQRLFGGKLTAEQARQMGMLDQTIQRMVTQSLLDQSAQHLGLTVDNETLRKTIAATPAFQNQLKVFDRTVYQETLRSNGFTETRFEAAERRDIVRGELAAAISGGVVAPKELLDPLFHYREERRVAETITFAGAKMPAPAKPEDSVLQAFHKDHASAFMAPELRAVTAIVVRTADIAGDIKPSDADIQKAYQERQGEFTVEETRSIRQVLFPDKAAAQAMVDAVKKGQSFDDAAKAAGKEVTDLGKVDRKAMPFTQLADTAFALAAPGIAGPVQTELGWHVLDVSNISPGSVKPLAEVRDKIVQGLVKDEAINRLYALSTKMEDAIGSGAPLEEAASNLQLKLLKIPAIDQSGNGTDGKPAAGVPDSPAFRQAVFQTAQGSTSDVSPLENDDGYFVVRVDQVTPPTLKPFEQVKDQVLAAWTAEQQAHAAQKMAAEAAEKINHGETLAAVAGNYAVATTKPFLRTGTSDVPGAVAAAVFGLEPGKAASVTVPEGAVVAQLKEIVPADPEASSSAYQQLREQLEQGIAADMVRQYVASLERQYGMSLQQAQIDQQFGQQ